MLLLFGEHVMQEVYSTDQAAKIVKVSARTISKWFDSGRLPGYRIPPHQERRIPRDGLVKFLRDHGMPEAADEVDRGDERISENIHG